MKVRSRDWNGVVFIQMGKEKLLMIVILVPSLKGGMWNGGKKVCNRLHQNIFVEKLKCENFKVCRTIKLAANILGSAP